MKIATVFLSLSGLAAGFAMALLWPRHYTAIATLDFTDQASRPGTLDLRRSEFFEAARAEVLSAGSLAGIRPDEPAETLRRDTRIQLAGNVCTIQFTDTDRHRAQRVTNALISRFFAIAARTGKERRLIPPSRRAMMDRLDWLEARTAKLEGIPSYMGEVSDHIVAGGAFIGVEVLDPPTVAMPSDGWWRWTLVSIGGFAGWCAARLLRMRLSRY
jgi:hypothetical protein